MKKCISIFSFILFIASCAFAGTTTLTTYYPAPTAAYNKVNISTNYNPPNGTQAACGGSIPIGSTYFDTTTNVLSVCTSTGNSSPANGTIYHKDNTGILHVVMNGQDATYPQECFNKFCSYTIVNGQICSNVGSCAYMTNPTPSLPQGNCPSGFNQLPVDPTTDWYDLLQTSNTTCVASIVCCTSSYNSGASSSVGYPPDETSTIPN